MIKEERRSSGDAQVRVLLVAYHFDEYVMELVNSLSKLPSLRIKLVLVTNKPVPDAFHTLDITVIPKPRIRNVMKNRRVLREIKENIRDFEPAVVHHQGCTLWFNILLRRLCRNNGIVYTIHDVTAHVGEKKLWLALSESYARRHSHIYIVHGKYLKERLVDLHKWIAPKDVFVIPHGRLSTYSRINPEKYDERQNTVLFFGRIHAYKGLDFLIKAEPLIAHEIAEFRIVIAGTGEDFTKYERLMTDKSRYAILNRYIYREEVPKIFGEASVVVLPYIEASQSGVVPLAYEYSKPVVVTNVGSVPEVVDEGVTGYIVQPRDSRQIADKIVRLLKNPELRRTLGRNGHAKLLHQLNWDVIARMTAQAYKSAAQLLDSSSL